MKLKLFIFFFVYTFNALQLTNAQNSIVEGYITDENSEPLAAATVYIENIQKGTATDSNGYFSISGLDAGDYDLSVSMIGFLTHHERVTLSNNSSVKLSIELQVQDYTIGDDVVVTATRTEQAVATAPASISVISAQALEQQPVADLTDVLREIPGVSLSASSQGRKTIQLRGMESSHTLLLIDGKRVNSSEAVFRHNDFDLGMLPIGAIDRIEVVRGGMSALYGSEALGGVINVITKPVSNQWKSKVSSEFQTPTTGEGGEEFRTSFYSSGALATDKLGLTLTGTFNHRNVWHGWDNEQLLNNGNPETRPDGSLVNRKDLATLEGRNDHNLRGKFTWSPAKNQTVEAEYGQAFQTRKGEYFIRGWGEADTEIHRNDVVITHKSTFSGGNSEVRAYQEWIETKSDGLNQSNSIIEGNFNATISKIHSVTIGGEARWLNLEAPAEFTSGSANVSQQALYIQDEIKINKPLKVLAGARMDHHENFDFHLTPRAYIVYSATDKLVFKGGVGTAFKAPTLRQLSNESRTTSCRGACLIVGDPNLSPETSTNYEISSNYKSRFWGGSVTAFQNNVDNLIDTPRGDGVPSVGVDAETGLEIYVPRNVNKARIRGVEVTIFTSLSTIGRLTANYTLLDAKDLSSDQVLQNRPNHNFNTQFSWYISTDASAFIRGKYIGEQVTSAGEIDPYSIFDIGGSYYLRHNIKLRAGITNVANIRTDNPDDNYSFAERARTVFVGFSADF